MLGLQTIRHTPDPHDDDEDDHHDHLPRHLDHVDPPLHGGGPEDNTTSDVVFVSPRTAMSGDEMPQYVFSTP